MTDSHFSKDRQVSTDVHSGIAEAVQNILVSVGEDPLREGLLQTPQRVERMYAELTEGYHMNLAELINGAIFQVDYTEMVTVVDIEFFSLCEHHLLPFFGKVHVAYIPGRSVIGLSKIPRIVEMYARRLQIQERLTTQIAEALDLTLRPRGVAVVIEAQHMCSMMRGVKKVGASLLTQSMLGTFKDDMGVRQEFFSYMRCKNKNNTLPNFAVVNEE
ncbi:MAG: GTP cyclohydrolase I FolE [Ktedonobacteraceae bacterium]